MLVDFHTHTSSSDGELSPLALIERAAAAGVTALAITDHDTLAGYRHIDCAVPAEMTLVPGVEVSCVWGATTIHVVGLGFDMTGLEIQSLIDRLESAREQRAETIGRRLAKAGFEGAYDGARRLAGEAQVGRPHFARWLVEQGFLTSESRAFDRYLGRGKLGDVKTFWPPMAEAVRCLTESGGIAVLAHPLHYALTRMKLSALCVDFAAAGGRGIELYSGKQSPPDTARLRQVAETHGFKVSLGSDFHRPWLHGPELGVCTDVARGMPSVWEGFL